MDVNKKMFNSSVCLSQQITFALNNNGIAMICIRTVINNVANCKVFHFILPVVSAPILTFYQSTETTMTTTQTAHISVEKILHQQIFFGLAV